MTDGDTSFFSQIEQAAQNANSLPPVHLWQPEQQGEIDIVIDKKGRWFHEGGEIKRQALVKLFASVLTKHGEDYFLVTPVEKQQITVEDLPFTVVLMEQQGQNLRFLTNTDDVIIANSEHAIVAGQPGCGPCLHVRNGLFARINRSVYYQLAEIAEEIKINDKTVFQVHSDGVAFILA